jgi:hypothetical protein
MARGDRTFNMLLEVRNGLLDETLTVLEEDQNANRNPIRHQKLHKRASKREFRDMMKDPSKFAISDMADPNHPTIIAREGGGFRDEVNFLCFESFTIFFEGHPDVIEDPANSPDGPFTSGGAVITSDTAVDQGGAARPDKFKAGPYRVAGNARNQKFWKFFVVTVSGLTLDPCIIIEP